MIRYIFLFFLMFSHFTTTAQDIKVRIEKAVSKLLQDPQMKHGLLGFHVVDTKTGTTVFSLNEEIGMAPASTQKIITAATAFELLKPGYRFKTTFNTQGATKDSIVSGDLVIKGFGDPTLGSTRWKYTQDSVLFRQLKKALLQKGIKSFRGDLLFDLQAFETQSIPGGWCIDDVGNYYGAGCYAINWKENQYDIFLQSGQKEGSSVNIKKVSPFSTLFEFSSEAIAMGSSDEAYIFLPIDYPEAVIRGSIPAGENNYSISAAAVQPYLNLVNECKSKTKLFTPAVDASTPFVAKINTNSPLPFQNLYTHYSPTLDSLIYWFLQKSINLYGEAIVKAISFEKDSLGSTERGIQLIQSFWSDKGLDAYSLNMLDGSGLSPQNRVTPRALVSILQYAVGRPWFQSFFQALPTYNGIKMKSGTIGGVKGFAGYHTASDGRQYSFAILVNNYDSKKGSISQKIYQLLNELK